jgi:hypothetical protein
MQKLMVSPISAITLHSQLYPARQVSCCVTQWIQRRSLAVVRFLRANEASTADTHRHLFDSCDKMATSLYGVTEHCRMFDECLFGILHRAALVITASIFRVTSQRAGNIQKSRDPEDAGDMFLRNVVSY